MKKHLKFWGAVVVMAIALQLLGRALWWYEMSTAKHVRTETVYVVEPPRK